jgi:hypothetical protein
MKGFIYRLGITIKEIGEKAGHKQRFFAGLIVCVGIFIRSIASRV